MRIHIATRNMSLTNAMRDFVHMRLRRALGRFARRITETAVTFEDMNGPRGGLDVHCRIRLVLRPHGEVNVSAMAAQAGAALSEASRRAVWCVKNRIRRRWRSRRRSRKSLAPDGGFARLRCAPGPAAPLCELPGAA